VSKNISNLSGRIGLKDNLFKQISENTLSDTPQDINEIAKEHNSRSFYTLHGAESFLRIFKTFSQREKSIRLQRKRLHVCRHSRQIKRHFKRKT
jgi:NADH-quinone oxidoreductase subunit F